MGDPITGSGIRAMDPAADFSNFIFSGGFVQPVFLLETKRESPSNNSVFSLFGDWTLERMANNIVNEIAIGMAKKQRIEGNR